MTNQPTKRLPWMVIWILLLPLLVIAIQRVLGFHGMQSSLYKVCLLVPPLVYCQSRRLDVWKDILKFQRWRSYFGYAIGLGLAASFVFWIAYLMLGDLLLDKTRISEQVRNLFVTNADTVLYVAPITIFLNSLLEEFFYRGFAFGQLVRYRQPLGYALPAMAFTIQHLLFFWQWMDWIPLAIAVTGLMVFALVQQWLYDVSDSIVAPWLVHIFGDFALMAIAIRLFLYET